jgi:putative ABC transport system permease protein
VPPAPGNAAPFPDGAPPPPGRAASPPADPARIRAAIEGRPGTASYYGTAEVDVAVAGVPKAVRAVLYDGDSRRGSPAMISGHWIAAAGEAVVPTRFLATTDTAIGDTVRVTYRGDTRTLRIVGEAFDTSDDGMRVHTDLTGFAAARPDAFHVDVDSGVRVDQYAQQLSALVRPLGGEVMVTSRSGSEGTILILEAMAALLTLMLVCVAGLGVLNAVVLDTRERVHDLGVCKALGMTPRQTVSLVLASVTGIGILGGLVGVPLGYALHRLVIPMMGHAAGTNLPSSVLDVYDASHLLLLGLAGIAIATVGALLPAAWAAKSRTATALRTE